MASTFKFLRTFLSHPGQVGAIAPSGPALVRLMTDWIDWPTASAVVEYGPGTGVFTEAIEQRCRDDAVFFAIEKSSDLAEVTRRRCPSVTVHEDSAANIAKLCGEHGVNSVDAILCGLPWAAFPDQLQREIMDATLDVLRPGGQFATFAYWQGVMLPAGRRFARLLDDRFDEVHRSDTAWRNLPPAFVYRCRKRPVSQG